MASWLNLLSGALGGLGAGVLGIGSWRLRFQNDAKQLNPEKRIFLESKIRELADRLRIDKPVELIEVIGLTGHMQAQGIACLSGRIGIAIDPLYADGSSQEELEFILAHELAHIKANDWLWGAAYTAAVGVSWTAGMINFIPASATYFSSKLVTCGMAVASPAAAVGLAVSVAASGVFMRWREREADKLACSICSDAAQQAGVNYFANMAISGMVLRSSEEGSFLSRLKNKLLIEEDGSYRLDFFHPSLLSREVCLRALIKKA